MKSMCIIQSAFSKLKIKLPDDILEVIIPNLFKDKSLRSPLKYDSVRKVSESLCDTKLSTKFISLVTVSNTSIVAYNESKLSTGTLIILVVTPTAQF